jgi:hypothetical protein
VVIFDEMDQIIGKDSLMVKYPSGSNKMKIIFPPAMMKNIGQIIGFSGTMASVDIGCLRSYLGESLLLTIPNMKLKTI